VIAPHRPLINRLQCAGSLATFLRIGERSYPAHLGWIWLDMITRQRSVHGLGSFTKAKFGSIFPKSKYIWINFDFWTTPLDDPGARPLRRRVGLRRLVWLTHKNNHNNSCGQSCCPQHSRALAGSLNWRLTPARDDVSWKKRALKESPTLGEWLLNATDAAVSTRQHSIVNLNHPVTWSRNTYKVSTRGTCACATLRGRIGIKRVHLS